MKAGIDAKRARGEPTVPSLLGDERKCNPFLRPGRGLGWCAAGRMAGVAGAGAAQTAQTGGLLDNCSVLSLPSCLPADSPAIRAALGVPAGASNDEAFGAIRSAKDTFR